LAFSGLALLHLAALYLYLAFFLLLARSPEKYRHAAPEALLLRGNRTKILPQFFVRKTMNNIILQV
jgi:hypothetical protein